MECFWVFIHRETLNSILSFLNPPQNALHAPALCGRSACWPPEPAGEVKAGLVSGKEQNPDIFSSISGNNGSPFLEFKISGRTPFGRPASPG